MNHTYQSAMVEDRRRIFTAEARDARLVRAARLSVKPRAARRRWRIPHIPFRTMNPMPIRTAAGEI
jgi:hypothetical protein